MQLSVSALDREAAVIGGADSLNAATAYAIDGIGVIAHAFLLFLRTTLGGSPGVMAGDHHIGRVRLLPGVEGVANHLAGSSEITCEQLPLYFGYLFSRILAYRCSGA